MQLKFSALSAKLFHVAIAEVFPSRDIRRVYDVERSHEHK